MANPLSVDEMVDMINGMGRMGPEIIVRFDGKKTFVTGVRPLGTGGIELIVEPTQKREIIIQGGVVTAT